VPPHHAARTRVKPKAVDLFSGAGGLTEGLRQAGYTVVGAVEINAQARATYRLNHRRVHLWGKNISRVSGRSIMRALNLRPGELDLLAACPPCEGFSQMRTKNGARRNFDKRNDLIFEVLRMVRSLRPVSLMVENVPGLAKNYRFRSFLKSLHGLGYQTKWSVVNAADYGVPQKRRRLVLLACRIAEPQFAAKAPRRWTVRQTIGRLNLPEHSRDPLHNYSPARRSEKIQRVIEGIPRNGGSRQSLKLSAQLKCHRDFDGFYDVYGRMAWDAPSPTITSGCINPSKGRFLHPRFNRAITLREAALLQSFPRKYQFSLAWGRYAVARMIGNALPPEFVRRHAAALSKSRKNSSARPTQEARP
jgi:DNA (cytosine-5)-methyltransferase 1